MYIVVRMKDCSYQENKFMLDDVEIVGCYDELSEAKDSVINNKDDIYDDYYKYVVIEEAFDNGCMTSKRYWYKWSEGYQEIIQPVIYSSLDRVCNEEELKKTMKEHQKEDN